MQFKLSRAPRFVAHTTSASKQLISSMQADEEFDCVAGSASQDDDQDIPDEEESEPAAEQPTVPEPVREGPDWCFGSGSFQSVIPPACLEGAGGGVILGMTTHLKPAFVNLLQYYCYSSYTALLLTFTAHFSRTSCLSRYGHL
jgi:hypothetical protein